MGNPSLPLPQTLVPIRCPWSQAGCEAGVYLTKCPPPRNAPPGSPTPDGPHLFVGLGKGQPHALVGGAAEPRWASLAAEARTGIDAADAREARMGGALQEEGPGRIRGRGAGPPRKGRLRALWTCKVQGPSASYRREGLPCGAEAIAPEVTHGFALTWERARPGEERGLPGAGLSLGPGGLDAHGRGKKF